MRRPYCGRSAAIPTRRFAGVQDGKNIGLSPLLRHRQVQGTDPLRRFSGNHGRGQALTQFFKRDSTKANNLTLYPSQGARVLAVDEFMGGLHQQAI